MIYHPAYRLFLLSWSVTALFCLPCSFLSSLSSSVPLCPRSIALTSVLSVTVCSLCPGLSPSVLSSLSLCDCSGQCWSATRWSLSSVHVSHLFPRRPTCLKSPCILIHYTILYSLHVFVQFNAGECVSFRFIFQGHDSAVSGSACLCAVTEPK